MGRNEVDGETQRDQLGEAQGKLQSKLPARKRYPALIHRVFSYGIDGNTMDLLSNSLLILQFSLISTETTAISSRIVRFLLIATRKINHPS